MSSTTHTEYHRHTEALQVATDFASGIHGKVILVTGVNLKGVGYAIAEAFASQSPSHLIVAGRNPSRLEESISAMRKSYPSVDYRPLILDLSTQATVRHAADDLLSWNDLPKLDIIVNSAGIMNQPERKLNEDGIELTFATNHVGHFLFTNLVMSKLIAASKHATQGRTRIINVSSLSPTRSSGIRWSDLNFDKVNRTLPEHEQPPYELHRMWGTENAEDMSYLPLEAYSQSKVANVLFSVGLNNNLYDKHGILSIAIHPGIIETELGRSAPQKIVDKVKSWAESNKTFYQTQGSGASTVLVAALDPRLSKPEKGGEVQNRGVYMADCQISEKATWKAVNDDQAQKLWALSEDLTKQKFTY